ncbi:MAG: hypothetical protein RMK19_08970 [Bacteroidia bacterium]|nr:hypothetical protein [Bacteroidia bacterium]MDW8016124.1 hypothetical protein [Bacteroidia bacterium]
MTSVIGLWLQAALSLQWGEPRSQAFWQLYGAELRKTSAYEAPHAYTLLLNGADAYGLPYQTTNSRESEWGDSAICDCIRMDSIGPAMVSFAYQRGGLMEPPEADDTLMLWGLTATGEWRLLWHTQGTGLADSSFTVVQLFLQDSIWFHPCFRLKWSTWGSTYGGYDNWHIGYTFIATDTIAATPYWKRLPRIYDKTYGRWGPTYTPLDSVCGIIKISDSIPTVVEVRVDRRVIFTQTYQGVGEFQVCLPPFRFLGRGIYSIEWIWHRFATADSGILLDTLVLEGNQWGYDDEEMETGYGLRQAGRAFLQVFRLDTPQLIKRIGVQFFPLPTQYGKPFQLGVWDINQGTTPLYLKIERVLVDSTNSWQWYEVDTPLVIGGQVGLGFIQLDGQPLGVGWDASCAIDSAVRLEFSGGWTPSEIKGCMMVRVELGSVETALSFPSPPKRSHLIVGQAGELLSFPKGACPPLMIWDTRGQFIALWSEGDIEAPLAGMYICTDTRGQVWRLVVRP